MSFCLSLICFCFCFYYVCFICFCFLFCFVATYLPGRNCSRTLTFFVLFHLLSLSLSVAPPATGELRALCPRRCSLFPTFCFFLLHYTTQTFTYTHALDYFAFGPFALFAFVLFLLLSRLFSFCVFLFVVCFVLFLFSGFFLSFFLLRTFSVAVLRFFFV